MNRIKRLTLLGPAAGFLTAKDKYKEHGTRCHACGKEYFVPSRLQNHLNYSGECFRKMLQAGRRQPHILPGINSTLAQKDRKLKVPVLKSQGPREQAFEGPAWQHEEEYDTELIDQWLDMYEAAGSHTPLEDLVEGVRSTCSGSTSSFWVVQRTLQHFTENVKQEEIGDTCSLPHAMVIQSLDVALKRYDIRWFFGEEEVLAEATDDSIRNASWDHCHSFNGRSHWENQDYVPRMKSSTLVYLHLFSGNRREGDLHSALSSLRAPPGGIVAVISVDIIYDEVAQRG